MTYQLILPWDSSSNFLILSAWSSIKLFLLGKPTSNKAFGLSEPSLVPCPPARSITPTSFLLIASRPTSLQEQSSSSGPCEEPIISSLTGSTAKSLVFLTLALLNILLTCLRSKLLIWSASFTCSARSKSFQNLSNCCCPDALVWSKREE